MSNLKQPTLEWELAAVKAAALVVVLSKSDADFVRQHLLPPGLQRPVKVSDTLGQPTAPQQPDTRVSVQLHSTVSCCNDCTLRVRCQCSTGAVARAEGRHAGPRPSTRCTAAQPKP